MLLCFQVKSALEGSDVWATYRDQQHDLFLPSGKAAMTLEQLLELACGRLS